MKTYRNPLAYLKHPVELATLALSVLSQSRGAQGTSRGLQSSAAATPALAPGKSAPASAPAPVPADSYCAVDRQVNANYVDACQIFKVCPDAPDAAGVWPYAGPRALRAYGTSETPPCQLASVTALQPDSRPDVPVALQAEYPGVSHDLLNTDGIAFDYKCNLLKKNVQDGCPAPVHMC